MRAAQEPGWILSGHINPLYEAALSDEEARRRVLSLAAHLGERLGQERVYATYGGTQYILEREKGEGR